MPYSTFCIKQNTFRQTFYASASIMHPIFTTFAVKYGANLRKIRDTLTDYA